MPLLGTSARLFLNEVDLSCATSELSVELTSSEHEAATLCSTTADFSPGFGSGVITTKGFFKGPLLTTDEEGSIYAALGASTKTVAALFDYGTLPAAAYCIQNAGNYGLTYTSPTDGLLAMDGSFKGLAGVKRGNLCFYKLSRTATGIGTAVRIVGTVVGSTGKCFAFVHSITGTAATPITFTLQSSANGTTGWATEASHSFATIGAEVLDWTAPAGEYFGINVTSLGGATSFIMSIIVVVNGVTT
jgi:hypothetical protein